MGRGRAYPSRSSRGSSVRFATVNLFARFVDVEHFAAVLDEVAPDLVVAEELSPEAAGVMAARFPHHHLAPERSYSGWGIASRYPIQVEPGQPGWVRGGAATIELPATTLHLAAVHILDPMHRPLKESAAIRARQVDALLDWGDGLPDGEPQLVAGDLNATPLWSVYRRLASRWDDLVASGSPGTRPLRTWGIPRGLRILRIDHVLGTGLVATGNRVARVRGSDHAMVIVELELAQ